MPADDTIKMRPASSSAPTQKDLSNIDGREELPDSGMLEPGTMVGEYIVDELLGSGGFAQVYRARHRLLGRQAALKVLHSDMASSSEMVQRFIREAVVVNRIGHPNIVDIYDFGRLPDQRPYFVMELLRGRSLAALFDSERRRCTAAEALTYLEPVCSALQAAHQAGVVHRDLKATNIMVCGDEQHPLIKLLDFGIAKLLHPEPGEPGLTKEGARLGSSYAMAPEQIRGGAIDGRTDVYALGALLFRLLTGQHPFWSNDPLEIERLHLQAPPPRPSALAPISPAVEAVVLRCLEKDPSRRYASPKALIEALSEAVLGPVKHPPKQGLARVVALYAEVNLNDPSTADDAVLTELATVLDGIERQLTEAGFGLLLQTASSILGVRTIPKDGAVSLSIRQELLALAKSLYRTASHSAGGSRLKVSICAHVGEAETRNTAEGLKLTGGPIARLHEWVLRGGEGWHATKQAMEGLSVLNG